MVALPRRRTKKKDAINTVRSYDHLRKVLSDRSRPVLLFGAPGIGKTHTAREVLGDSTSGGRTFWFTGVWSARAIYDKLRELESNDAVDAVVFDNADDGFLSSQHKMLLSQLLSSSKILQWGTQEFKCTTHLVIIGWDINKVLQGVQDLG